MRCPWIPFISIVSFSVSQVFSSGVNIIDAAISNDDETNTFHSSNNESFHHALELWESIPSYSQSTIDAHILQTYESVDKINIDVPQDQVEFSYHLNEIRKEKLAKNNTKLEILNTLSILADDKKHLRAALMLGEIYMFGNKSFPKDGVKALHYFKLATTLGDDENSTSTQGQLSQAHFMTGIIYSNGLFGIVPIDQSAALLHFKSAASLQDPRALMVLGYRHLMGIGVSKSCSLAMFYYSGAAKILTDEYVLPELATDGPYLESFSVRIKDFNNADFLNGANKKNLRYWDSNRNALGNRGQGNNLNNFHGVFELPNSVVRRVGDLSEENAFNELILDYSDYKYVNNYQEVLVNYEGDYINKRNYTKAYQYALECANDGLSEYGEFFDSKSGEEERKRLKTAIPNSLAIHITNKCIGIVGHMLFRGEGVQRNPHKAYQWLSRTGTVGVSADTLVDFGLMYEFGMLDGKKNPARGVKYYKAAAKKGHSGASYHLGRVYLSKIEPRLATKVEYPNDINDEAISTSYQESSSSSVLEKPLDVYQSVQGDDLSPVSVITYLQQAAYSGSNNALYDLARLYEADFASGLSCTEIVKIYKSFVEKLENKVGNLDWALQRVLIEDYENAILSYSIAAEMGIETAQSSVASLLWQPKRSIDRVLELALEESVNDKSLESESSMASNSSLLKNLAESRLHMAANYLTKSSQQQNIDSSVLLGDMYYYNLLNSSNLSTEDNGPGKAAAFYQLSSLQQSSQASWNLGYMYENGIGVEKDFHLAKRYYDLALVNHPEASLPVQLSLIKLGFKKWLYGLCGWEVSNQNDEVEIKKTWGDWWETLVSQRRGWNEILEGSDDATRSDSDNNLGTLMDEGNDQIEGELTASELFILASFGCFLVLVYGIPFYFRWRRRRENEQRRARGEVVEDEPQRPLFQGFFVVAPI
ncbi:ubiquitin ligase complex subunit [Saccharomycopsis crataegensis]|uniref:Ubiquitin ligase complex subunit n=1 Tax=Saccharomycopsis crataegensis TaxID=43959 RepID=A0AAV5QIN0_9ASCO|nr:ubiquitin ligase complex subunit [Saccharomycopsis crataegensis]